MMKSAFLNLILIIIFVVLACSSVKKSVDTNLSTFQSYSTVFMDVKGNIAQYHIYIFI